MDRAVKWSPRKQNYQDALKYMRGRQLGKITSFKTRWSKFNDAGADGIEFHSMVVIAGRPGALKSAMAEQIIRDGFELNRNMKLRALCFNFEMLGKVNALREFSAATGKSYKYLCSADGTLSDQDLKDCYEYAKDKAQASKYPIDIINDPMTVIEFSQIVNDYMETYKEEAGLNKEGVMEYVYINTVITIDHSLLFARAPFEHDIQDTLTNLGKAITALKKKYPIIFIVLSQLNRNVEKEGRNEDGKYGNYILSSDLYASDSMLQFSDIVIGLDRPALRDIKYYSPSRFIIEDARVLVVRWIKCRNGENQTSFFRIDFNSMSIDETDVPAQAITQTNKNRQPIEKPEQQQKPLQPNNLFTQES